MSPNITKNQPGQKFRTISNIADAKFSTLECKLYTKYYSWADLLIQSCKKLPSFSSSSSSTSSSKTTASFSTTSSIPPSQTSTSTSSSQPSGKGLPTSSQAAIGATNWCHHMSIHRHWVSGVLAASQGFPYTRHGNYHARIPGRNVWSASSSRDGRDITRAHERVDCRVTKYHATCRAGLKHGQTVK